MSIECEICDSTIFIPDAVWYAGTVFGHRRVTVCGSCACCIPVEERGSFMSEAPFGVNFGVVSAEPNMTGNWYNAAGAVNGPVRFTASTEAIEKSLPNSGFLLRELSPHYRVEWYVTQTVEEYLKEKESGPAAREKAIKAISPYFQILCVWCKVQQLRAAGSPSGTRFAVPITSDRNDAEKLLDDLVEVVRRGIEPD